MYNFLTLDQAELENKRVLLRVDFNVPVQDGVIIDVTRIERALPTIKYLLSHKAKVIIASHLGRPNGRFDQSLTLLPIAQRLESLLGHKVGFGDNKGGDIYMLENLRFNPGEELDDDEFAKQLASYADIYVNDGFAVSHRAHASVSAITNYLPSYAGLLMNEELSSLGAALLNPVKPVAAIVGGAKVSSKLRVLKNLVKKVDYLIPTGGIANTFLLQNGVSIGSSLAEPSLLDEVSEIIDSANLNHCQILLPIDAMVAANLDTKTPSLRQLNQKLDPEDKIFDIGPDTLKYYESILDKCKTLVWNGPLGVFEVPPYDMGTKKLAQYVGKQCVAGSMYAVAGGGETIAALNKSGVLEQINYASTAGGAFLEWLEGREMPGVKALENYKAKYYE